MAIALPPPYQLRLGSLLDRAKLVQFMQRTYQELYPQQGFAHLAHTVEAYLSRDTPLWWIDPSDGAPPEQRPRLIRPLIPAPPGPVACLWMGTAVDQVRGDRHAHIFLLYVDPAHRRRGLGRGLMMQAEDWAKQRGDRQISLQVFHHNAPALSLYASLGYQAQSIALIKPLFSPSRPRDDEGC